MPKIEQNRIEYEKMRPICTNIQCKLDSQFSYSIFLLTI